ncbi:MAG: amidohydrolase family protein, partial [Gemmatimonadota bacterium]
LGYDAQPRFSPDGTRIVFVSDRSGTDNLWVMSADGRDTTQVTKDRTPANTHYVSPEWTPDGKSIVATKEPDSGTPGKLWLFDPAGGTGLELVHDPVGNRMLGAAFGPDPRYVWYATRAGAFEYNAIFPLWQVAVYDRSSGTRTVMTGRYGSGFRPALSPDGKWLTYGTRQGPNTGLVLRDLATGTERWLAYPIQRDEQESSSPLDLLPGYSFTPDSRALVMSYGGEIWRVPVDGTKPSRIPFQVDEQVEMGPEVRFVYRVDTSATLVAKQVRDAVPSPDGKRLAFTALDKVWVMDVPGGTPRRVSNLTVHEHQPAWSPDGASLAFVTWSDREGGHVYRVSVGSAAQTPTRLTSAAARYSQPVWSPDGGRIVAVRAASRDMQETLERFSGGFGAEFVWVPAAGGAVSVIAPTGGRGAPHFTRDPARIFAYSLADGLVSMRWDGTDIKAHVKVTGPSLPGAGTPPSAALVLMAPVGDQALAQVGTDLYTVTVPFVGGVTPTVSVADPATAAFPVRRLTDIGGEFPAWSSDGRQVHWSIGNAHLVYDLDRAKVVEDSLKRAKPDSTAGPDSAKRGYRPAEYRIRVTGVRDEPKGATLFRGGRVVSMKGKEIIENADLLVIDNRIAALGARGSVTVPAGAKVFDVTGQTIVPGFIDAHAHYRVSPGIHFDQPWAYLANLAFGVTTSRDPQTGTTDVLAYGDLVETGQMIGPRIYSTGPGVFSGEMIKSLDQARDVLKRYSEYFTTNTIKMYMSGNRQQRQWIIMAAKELGLMPTTEGGIDFKLNMTHALDGYPGIEHTIPIYPMFNDVVDLFVRSGVANTPTLIVSYGGPWAENYYYATETVHDNPKMQRFLPDAELDARSRRRGQGASPGPGGWFSDEEHIFRRHAEFAKHVIEQGGRIGIGGHGQLQGLAYHWEIWSVQSGGMSTHDALRAATILGAEAIGMSADLGSIETGKLADLVVLEKSPLENIRNTTTIRYVMKNGRLYDGNTLDELWPTPRALPEPVWRNSSPAVSSGIR